MEIYSKLLTPWLKFYYRSCLSRQIFSFISFFSPFTYRSRIFSTSFVLLRLFVQIILFFFLSNPSLLFYPRDQLPASPIIIFLFKETARKYIMGETGSEKEERRISRRYQETAGLFLMKPRLHFCTFVNHSQMFFCHHLITMCTFTEGRPQSAKGHSNASETGEHTPVMTVSRSM